MSGFPVLGCIITVGFLATLYTVLGGMKAVVWTDFVQFIVLAVGQDINWMWTAPSSSIVTFVTGYTLSLVFDRSRQAPGLKSFSGKKRAKLGGVKLVSIPPPLG